MMAAGIWGHPIVAATGRPRRRGCSRAAVTSWETRTATQGSTATAGRTRDRAPARSPRRARDALGRLECVSNRRWHCSQSRVRDGGDRHALFVQGLPLAAVAVIVLGVLVRRSPSADASDVSSLERRTSTPCCEHVEIERRPRCARGGPGSSHPGGYGVSCRPWTSPGDASASTSVHVYTGPDGPLLGSVAWLGRN
jgi:hypothetical protein